MWGADTHVNQNPYPIASRFQGRVGWTFLSDSSVTSTDRNVHPTESHYPPCFSPTGPVPVAYRFGNYNMEVTCPSAGTWLGSASTGPSSTDSQRRKSVCRRPSRKSSRHLGIFSGRHVFASALTGHPSHLPPWKTVNPENRLRGRGDNRKAIDGVIFDREKYNCQTLLLPARIAGISSYQASGRNRITKDIASPRESDLRQVALRRQICFPWRGSVARGPLEPMTRRW